MTTSTRTIPMSEVIAIARELFVEAYEGPRGQGSWYISNGADAGLFATLAGLGADDASRPGRPGGPSIAAHVEHLRWSLANVNATIRGEAWNPDWSASWSVGAVDEAAWGTLRADVAREFAELRAALEAEPELSDPMMLRGVVALAPHAAYHLGAIRVLAKQAAA
jgi:hypothetical protein